MKFQLKLLLCVALTFARAQEVSVTDEASDDRNVVTSPESVTTETTTAEAADPREDVSEVVDPVVDEATVTDEAVTEQIPAIVDDATPISDPEPAQADSSPDSNPQESGSVFEAPSAPASPSKPDSHEISPMEQLVAGSVARMVSQTILHPIDVIRTRRQAVGVPLRFDPQTLVRGISPQFLLAGPAGAVQFGTLEFTRRAWSRIPTRISSRWLGGAAGRDLVSGAVGALAASAVRVPQEVLKQGIQAGLYDNAGEALAAVWGDTAEGRFGRFYKGFSATIMRDVPWNALSYTFFQALRTAYLAVLRRQAAVTTEASTSAESGSGDKEGAAQGAAAGAQKEEGAEVTTKQWQDLVIGAAAGSLAAVLTHPVDVIKTRIMTAKPAAAAAVAAAATAAASASAAVAEAAGEAAEEVVAAVVGNEDAVAAAVEAAAEAVVTGAPLKGAAVAAAKPLGVIMGIVDLVKAEGPGVLWRGLLPRLLYLAPLSSLIFATYQAVTTMLAKRHSSAPSQAGESKIEAPPDVIASKSSTLSLNEEL